MHTAPVGLAITWKAPGAPGTVNTGPMTAIEMSGCTLIAVFTHGTIGIMSAGLNAEAFVSPRYR